MAYVGGYNPQKFSARFARSNICSPTLKIVAPPLSTAMRPIVHSMTVCKVAETVTALRVEWRFLKEESGSRYLDRRRRRRASRTRSVSSWQELRWLRNSVQILRYWIWRRSWDSVGLLWWRIACVTVMILKWRCINFTFILAYWSRKIICLCLSLCFELLIFHILYLGSYSLFLGFYVSFYLFDFFWPHISGLLTLRWPFGQYVLCLYFYAIAGWWTE